MRLGEFTIITTAVGVAAFKTIFAFVCLRTIGRWYFRWKERRGPKDETKA